PRPRGGRLFWRRPVGGFATVRIASGRNAGPGVREETGAERFPISFWLWAVAARGAGAAREVVLAMVLGTSPWKDALVAAWTAPALMSSYCNETLPALLTPRWAQAQAGEPAGVRGLVTAIAWIQGALSLGAMLWPGWLITLIAPGLHGSGRELALTLERWLALNVALLGAQALLSTRLNAQRRFGWTPAGATISAAAVVGVLAFTRGWDLSRRVIWIAAAFTSGNVLAVTAMAAALYSARVIDGR